MLFASRVLDELSTDTEEVLLIAAVLEELDSELNEELLSDELLRLLEVLDLELSLESVLRELSLVRLLTDEYEELEDSELLSELTVDAVL